MTTQEIIEKIRGKTIQSIRLSSDDSRFEIKLHDGTIIKIDTDCNYADYHKLSVNVIGNEPDEWIN